MNAESAAREHKWEELETLANEMLKCSVTEEQERRAYELLVIAKTNMGEYESALEYVDRANSTEAVKQARQRCERMVNMK